ncbi:MAG: hypothetical protein NC223_04660 [Butyrivibrio sp.]|nr:hypothetical protein [Butyrivibrio sp.]
MQKKGFGKFRTPLIFTVLAVLAVSYYIYLSHRSVDNTDKMADGSVLSELLNRDMDLNYPSDYYEVMKYFSEVNKLWYKEELTQDQIVGLAQHVRTLYDEEFLSKEGNGYEAYLANLSNEIEAYRKEGRYINDYEVQKRSTIKTTSFQGGRYAMVTVKFYVRKGKKLDITYQKYTLRKDADSRWKILYWELSDGTEMAEK